MVAPVPTTTVMPSGSTASMPVMRSVERVISSGAQRVPSTRPVAPPRGTIATPAAWQAAMTALVSPVSRGRTSARAAQGSVGRVQFAEPARATRRR